MPIKIPNNLPARATLESENIFVMTETRAISQDIRPLSILIVNLMPKKIVTETQLMRCLSNTPLQIEITLLHMNSHASKNTSLSHLNTFYKTFDDVRNRKFDGCIITGAPVEQLDFEDVDYWDELCEIMDWTEHNVYSTLHICWASQAGLYHRYGVNKHTTDSKIFGIFRHKLCDHVSPLVRGFDDVFYAPHSRHTQINRADLLALKNLRILAESDEAGVFLFTTKDCRQVYVTGHPEYDADTLLLEYQRDRAQGLDISVPENYLPNDDPNENPTVRWRSHATLLYTNWLNYFVYQGTPYDLGELK